MGNPLGNVKHGGHGTLTYARWKSMMQRCSQTNPGKHPSHAGRGIAVCERWQDFASFLEDMSKCPDVTMTLDRLDNAKDYEPGNCRWATKAEQNRNRSHNIPLTHNGITRNLTDWAHAVGMTPNALAMRIRLGWTVERALTQPIKARTVK